MTPYDEYLKDFTGFLIDLGSEKEEIELLTELKESSNL